MHPLRTPLRKTSLQRKERSRSPPINHAHTEQLHQRRRQSLISTRQSTINILTRGLKAMARATCHEEGQI